MMLRLKRILLGCVTMCLMVAQSAMAIDVTTLGDLFKVAPHDTSIVLLKQVFGATGLASLGGEPGLFNIMFREFNQAMFGMIVIVLLYTVLLSIVQMANQGEFLISGKKPSLWMPARMVGGLVLVLPTKTGYSVIQIFMMWVVVQGVGAADVLWKATVDYLAKGGTVIAPVEDTTVVKTVSVAENFVARLICMHRNYYMYGGGGSMQHPTEDSDVLRPQYHPNQNLKIDGKTLTGVIDTEDFSDPVFLTPNCGKVSWLNTSYVAAVPTPTSDKDYDYKDKVRKALYQALTDSFPTSIQALNTPIKRYVFEGQQSTSGINFLDTFSGVVDADARAHVQDIAADDACSQTGKDEDCGIWQQAGNYGWANAGAYFYAIAGRNNENSGSADYTGTDDTHSSELPDDAKVSIVKGDPYPDNPLAVLGDNTNDDYRYVFSLAQDANKNLVPPSGIPDSDNPGSTVGGDGFMKALDFILAPVTASFTSMIFGKDNVTGQTDRVGGHGSAGFFSDPKVHPLIKLQSIGNNIVVMLTAFWIVLIGVTLILSIPAGICTMVSPAKTFFEFFYKLVLVPMAFVSSLLFSAGLSLSVYTPLIPFIIFIFGVIGWLLAVIETMIAAPMVALGLAHPEGDHEIWGRANPAVQMLMNMFFRPSLMIFGMIAGIIVSFVVVNFMSQLFGALLNSNVVSAGPIQRIMYIVIYVGLVLAILNKCFALIHIIPDKVFAWIGWQSSLGEYGKSGEDAVKGTFGAGAGAADKTMGAGWDQGKKGFESTEYMQTRAAEDKAQGDLRAKNAGLRMKEGKGSEGWSSQRTKDYWKDMSKAVNEDNKSYDPGKGGSLGTGGSPSTPAANPSSTPAVNPSTPSAPPMTSGGNGGATSSASGASKMNNPEQ